MANRIRRLINRGLGTIGRLLDEHVPSRRRDLEERFREYNEINYPDGHPNDPAHSPEKREEILQKIEQRKAQKLDEILRGSARQKAAGKDRDNGRER